MFHSTTFFQLLCGFHGFGDLTSSHGPEWPRDPRISQDIPGAPVILVALGQEILHGLAAWEEGYRAPLMEYILEKKN